MKKLIFLLLFLPCIIISQYTLIPDENFEVALKNLGYDSKIDGKVKTKKIKDVTSLTLNVAWFIDDSDEIAGIEDFGAPTDYSTAKTAVISLAKNIARKTAPDVRVNVIAPGNIYFENGSWDKKIKEDQESVDNMINSKVPMKRFGYPEEVGDAAVFLCSDKSKFITGTTLIIDGGQTLGLT